MGKAGGGGGREGGGAAHPDGALPSQTPLKSPPKPQPCLGPRRDHPPLAPLLIEHQAPRPLRPLEAAAAPLCDVVCGLGACWGLK